MLLRKSQESNLLVPFLSLFTSFSTLLCCALPALLVSLGMGATLIGLATNYPSLIWISEHKPLVFSLSFTMLALSAYMQYSGRNLPCPIDPVQARACKLGRLWSKRITIFSIAIWMIGAGFAFLPMLFA